jgi:hypothetical protein
MKAKLLQSHLVLLSFASLEVYLASFSLRFALFRIRSFGAPYTPTQVEAMVGTFFQN